MSDRGPWRSTRPKVPTVAMYTNPAPKYPIPSGLMAASTMKDKNPSLYQSPAYSMGLAWKYSTETLGPGPAAYKPGGKFTARGKDGGPYAFATWKPIDPLERRGPGPTDYDTSRKNNVWSKLKNAPASSMGSRDKGPKFCAGPGPSAYLPQHQNKAPEVVMGGKFPDTKPNGIPGPGAYSTPSVLRYKKGAVPAYSMGLKWTDVTPMTITPASNAHDVEPGRRKTKKQAPAYSFGNHHSEYASEVVTKDDIDGDCNICGKDDYCLDTAPPKPEGCPPVEC